MLSFFNKSSIYLWNKLPENVQTYLFDKGLTLSSGIWNRLPQSTQSYLFSKLMSFSSASTIKVELTQEDKDKIDSMIDSILAEMPRLTESISTSPRTNIETQSAVVEEDSSSEEEEAETYQIC